MGLQDVLLVGRVMGVAPTGVLARPAGVALPAPSGAAQTESAQAARGAVTALAASDERLAALVNADSMWRKNRSDAQAQLVRALRFFRQVGAAAHLQEAEALHASA